MELRARYRSLSRWERAVWQGAVVYAVVFSTLTVGRYFTLHTFAWDLGIYAQSPYTTLFSGRFLYSTPDMPNNPGGSLFGVHFDPILLFVLPLYALLPTPPTLLVLQSVAIAAGGPLVYRLARLHWPQERLAAVLAFVYFLHPAVQGVNWFDFHPEAFLIPFGLLMVYAWERKAWGWFALGVLLSLFTLEMSGIVVAGVGAYWVLASLPRRGWAAWARRRETWIALFVCAAGIVWAVVGISVVFAFNPGLALEENTIWQLVGATSIYQLPAKALANPAGLAAGLAFDAPSKVLYLIVIFGPVLFLPLRRPLTLVMVAPWLGAALTSGHLPFYAIGDQYPAFLIPFLFYAAVLGAVPFLRKPSSPAAESEPPKVTRRFPLRPQDRPFLLGVVVAVAFVIVASPASPVGFRAFNTGGLPIPDSHVAAVWSAVGLVPRDASILTQNNLFPYFTDRANSFVVPVAAYLRPANTFNSTVDGYLANVDYVLVDFQTSPVEAAAVLTRPAASADFGLLAWADGAVLLERAYHGPPVLELAFSETFPASSLAPKNASLVADPTASTGHALYHPAGAGPGFWTGPGVLLWPGMYNVTIRVRTDAGAVGPVLVVSADVRPGIIVVAGEIPGEGHAVDLTSALGDCNITLNSVTVTGASLGLAAGYQDITLGLRADVFGVYMFPAASATNATGIYLDRIQVQQIQPLGYDRALSCP